MKLKEHLKDITLWEKLMDSNEIPEIDLYMEQILTLLENQGVTKTMINNYSKEHLIDPVKGKKYNKEQILQILCILNLKQNMPLFQIGGLMGRDAEIDYRKVYDYCIRNDEKLSEAAASFVQENMMCDGELNDQEATLAAAMMLSSSASYFSRMCSELSGIPAKAADPEIQKKLDKAREKKEKKEKKALEKEMK